MSSFGGDSFLLHAKVTTPSPRRATRKFRKHAGRLVCEMTGEHGTIQTRVGVRTSKPKKRKRGFPQQFPASSELAGGEVTTPGERSNMTSQSAEHIVRGANMASLLRPFGKGAKLQFRNEEGCSTAVAILIDEGLLTSAIEFLGNNALGLSSQEQLIALQGKVEYEKL